MSVRFKILLIFTSILFVTSVYSEDILKKHILKYNNIEEKKEEKYLLDSAKLFYPLNMFSKIDTKQTNEIIHVRNKPSNELPFLVVLFVSILCSLVRVSFINNFKSQFNNFFTIRYKEIEEYQTIKKVFFISIYIGMVGYIASLFLSVFHLTQLQSVKYLYIILFVITIYFGLKWLILWFIKSIFKIEHIYKMNEYVTIDLIVVYLVIGLPILLLQSISIPFLKIPILVLLVVLFITMHLYKYFKLIINNNALFMRHITHCTIYFIAIEVLPLILFAKFLQINILHKI